MSTIAGNRYSGYADGKGTLAFFARPIGIAFDVSGRLLVADQGNAVIRRISSTGGISNRYRKIILIEPIASSCQCTGSRTPDVSTVFGGNGSNTHGVADGQGTLAMFDSPCYLTLDTSGNIYLADKYVELIRKVTPSGGTVTSLYLFALWTLSVDFQCMPVDFSCFNNGWWQPR